MLFSEMRFLTKKELVIVEEVISFDVNDREMTLKSASSGVWRWGYSWINELKAIVVDGRFIECPFTAKTFTPEEAHANKEEAYSVDKDILAWIMSVMLVLGSRRCNVDTPQGQESKKPPVNPFGPPPVIKDALEKFGIGGANPSFVQAEGSAPNPGEALSELFSVTPEEGEEIRNFYENNAANVGTQQ